MLAAMAYTTLKLHKSEYEADWIIFRAVQRCAKWVKETSFMPMAAVAIPVSVTLWIIPHSALWLAAS